MQKKHLLVLLTVCTLTIFACSKDSIAVKETVTTNFQTAAAAAATVGVCDFDLNETTLTSAGWSKIFEDNFSTDLNKWNIWTGGAYNNELQLYQASNLTLANGILNIAAVKETKTGPTTNYNTTLKSFDYTSGRIESKTLFSANNANKNIRMLARIKLPVGNGMWPAFWSYGDPWPTKGEIDILEARGNDPYKYQTNYFYGTQANINLVQGQEGYVTSESSLTSCWHVVDVTWTKSSLTFSLDGQVFKTNTGSYVGNLFGKQEKLVLNLAVGGLFFSNLDPTTIQTGTLQVDWVKVFKK